MAATSAMNAGPAVGDTSTAGAAAFAQGEGRPEAGPPGVFEELARAASSARETFSSFLNLVALEARRAGVALVWMVVGSIAAALFVVTAWLGLMAALVMGAMLIGVPAITAVVIVALINLGMAAVLVYWCIGKSRDLLFPATQRQLAGKTAVKPAA